MQARSACEECGFGFDADLGRLADRWRRHPGQVEEMLAHVDDRRLRTRVRAGVWAPIEYAAHIAEAVDWYADRVATVRAQDRPQLHPYDFDDAAVAGDYRRRGRAEVVDALRAACSGLADVVGALDPGELERVGLGSDGSTRSIGRFVARAEHELVHHELDLKRGTSTSA